MKNRLIAMLILFAGCIASSANLVLHIDSAAKTISITGFDSGISGYAWTHELLWEAGDTSGRHPDMLIDLEGAFDENVSGCIDVYDSVGLSLHLFSYGDPISRLTGTGLKISYADLYPEFSEKVPGVIGSQGTLAIGSGYGSISVIPEPNVLALFSIFGSGLWVVRRYFPSV